MFGNKADECIHIMTAYIASIKEYYLFIDTQMESFIKKYGEQVVEFCLPRVMLLLCNCGLA
ncbi:hypothetical protein [Clostridioides difficile]|uniref:hypothetical protein n=1 Tax=Clostridioides difficile TaxID=1496 RepID=UPI0021C91698|nr:hypothetical protein [Clostridioides difficile]UUV16696.1 hypothetical protein NQ183_20440 [Clostridioides difficile]